MRGFPVTGGEPAAAAAAAVEAAVASAAGPGVPKEVAGLLRAAGSLEYRTLQLAAVGLRLGLACKDAVGWTHLQARARAESSTSPKWGAEVIGAVLVIARHGELAQAVQAAKRALAEAQRSCAAAYAAQAAIVGRLPPAEADLAA